MKAGALIAPPVLGTIDLRPSVTAVHQSATSGQFLGGWNLSYLDKVPGLIGDFDGDGLDDFVIRSSWGVGLIGNDASDNLRALAMAPYGTYGSWNLSAADRLATVARLGTDTHASVIIQGASGLGVLRPSGGSFAIDTYPLGTHFGGWLLGANDKVLGAGPMGTTGDSFLIMSSWGLGLFDRATGTSVRNVAMWQNGTKVGSWVLDTTDPSFRFLGIGQFDGQLKPEFMVASRQGMAMLTLDASNNLALTSWVDYTNFFAPVTYGTGTTYYVTPLDALIAFKDLNHDGKADLLFQTVQGIVALQYGGIANSFSVLASHPYGTWFSGGWNFTVNDRLVPIVDDFDGDGQNDFTIESLGGWFGNLTVSGTDFVALALTTWSSMPLVNEQTLVGSGRFDHRAAREYLFKNPNPTLFTARTPVTTQHNDNNRTGAYLSETTLAPTAVQTYGMRLALSYTMDDQAFTQPLYLPDLAVNGVTKDVVVLTSARGSVYLFDANATADGYLAKWTLQDPSSPTGRPLVSFSATPVVDMTNQLLYVLYRTADAAETKCWNPNRDVAFWLAALDLHTGAIQRSVRVDATYPNHQPAFSFNSSAGNCSDTLPVPAAASDFIAQNQNARPGLLLDHGKIYAAFGMASQEEWRLYHGWVMRYDAETFEQEGVFNMTPENHNYDGAGIWGGGAGIVADAQGNVYVMTGNGPADPSSHSYGDSFVKLAPRGNTLQLAGSFSPCDAANWESHDVDLGSGGAVLIPGTDRLIGGGKSGELSVLATSLLTPGVNCASTSATLQFFQAFINSNASPPPDPSSYDTAGWQGGPHLHGSPTYWRGADPNFGYVYHWAEKDYARQFKYNVSTGLLDTNSVRATETTAFPANVVLSPNVQPNGFSVMPGGMMSLSANGNMAHSAVLWATSHWCTDFSNCNPMMDRLSAIDAESMALLWTSTVNAAVIPNWNMAHWGPPLIADGKVFVATVNNKLMKFVLNH